MLMWSISRVAAVGSWCPQLVQVCASRLSMRRLVVVGTCLGVLFHPMVFPPPFFVPCSSRELAACASGVAQSFQCVIDSYRVRWLQGLVSCSSRELVACTRGLNLSWWIVGESGDKTYKTTKALTCWLGLVAFERVCSFRSMRSIAHVRIMCHWFVLFMWLMTSPRL